MPTSGIRTSPPATPAIRARRWRWLSGSLLLLLFSPIVAVAIWYVCVRISNSRAVERLEAEVRQRGEPLTLLELQAVYAPIPDDENAAIPLLELWEKEDPEFWKAYRGSVRPLPDQISKAYPPALPILGSANARIERGATLSAESLAAAREFLANETGRMAAVHAALQRPKARFPLDYTNGYACLLPHLSRLKSEAQVFRLSALVSATRGDNDVAITALGDAARTGQLLADEPSLISHLVRLANLNIAVAGAEDLLGRAALTETQLQNLKTLLDAMKTTGGLKRALIGERVMAVSLFHLDARTAAAAMYDQDNVEDPADAGRAIRAGVGVMKVIGLAAADQRFMLEIFRDSLLSAEQASPDALKSLDEIAQRVSTASGRFPPKIFSGMLLPPLGRAGSKFAAQEARRSAALVAVAIEQYRLQHGGQLPEKLGQLVPQFLSEVPADPFDGQPLRFRTLENGYVVYSVGTDGRDDGGKERKPGRGGSQNIDETFTVER